MKLVCEGQVRRLYVKRGRQLVGLGRICEGCGEVWWDEDAPARRVTWA
jgi:hypothetical protein